MQVLMERVAFKPVSAIQVKPRWQLDPDLVLYLPLWNISGDVFLSQDAYGHTVTRYGATPAGQGGMSFDGSDDYLSVPDSDLFSFGDSSIDTAFSAEVWVFFISCGAGATFIGKDDNNVREEWLFYKHSNNRLSAVLWDQSAAAKIGRISATTFCNDNLNKWTHVAVTYDGSRAASGIALYANTIRVDTTNENAGTYVAMENLTEPVKVGIFASTSWPFDGRIGEVSLYKRALTEHEILTHFNATRGRYGGGA